ncbi:hypothetical protein OE509_32735, partial [Pseudomonas aeruginosa]|nr:hypothetical protein [Pseudomonas aeruginosa]
MSRMYNLKPQPAASAYCGASCQKPAFYPNGLRLFPWKRSVDEPAPEFIRSHERYDYASPFEQKRTTEVIAYLRIPRHSDTQPTLIRTPVPR